MCVWLFIGRLCVCVGDAIGRLSVVLLNYCIHVSVGARLLVVVVLLCWLVSVCVCELVGCIIDVVVS